MPELIVVLVIALLILGPKKLPDLAKALGKGFAEFKKAVDDVKNTVDLDLKKEKKDLIKTYEKLESVAIPEEKKEKVEVEDEKKEGEKSPNG